MMAGFQGQGMLTTTNLTSMFTTKRMKKPIIRPKPQMNHETVMVVETSNIALT